MTVATCKPQCNIDVNLLATNHFIAVVFSGERSEGRVNDATSQTEDKVERALFLDIIVTQSSPVLELLASEDKPLLIRRNAYSIIVTIVMLSVKTILY